jgi:two-component system, chemotaxis family, chemotaxis protein CheY
MQSMTPAHDAEASDPVQAPQKTGKPGRVLVIEDEASLREVIEVLVSVEGCEVKSAADGAQALDILRDWKPDLILLDLFMPGMSGREFVQSYRSGPGPHAPIIVLSGASEAPRDLAAMGCAGWLPKPFNVDELLAVVAKYADC